MTTAGDGSVQITNGAESNYNCDPENPNNKQLSKLSDIPNPATGNDTNCSSYTAYDLKNNIGVDYLCHFHYISKLDRTASLTFNSSEERAHHPSIYIEDLAGNRKLITNDQTKQDELVAIIQEIRPDDFTGLVGTTINGKLITESQVVDTSFLLDDAFWSEYEANLSTNTGPYSVPQSTTGNTNWQIANLETTTSVDIKTGSSSEPREYTIDFDLLNKGADIVGDIVYLEMRDPAGNMIDSMHEMNQTLVTNETKSYSFDWTPPATGDYVISLGIFDDDWSTTLYWEGQILEWTADKDSVINGGSTYTGTTLPQNQIDIVEGDYNLGTQPIRIGYPYDHNGRGKSLDFSLLVDNTNTFKGDFILPGWGDSIDGVCSIDQLDQAKVETDRNLTDWRYFNEYNPAEANINRTCPTPTFTNVDDTNYTPIYVVKDNTIEFETSIEKNQKVVMAYRYKEGQTDPANPNYQGINESYILREAVEVENGCGLPVELPGGGSLEVKDIDDTYITRFGVNCKNKFTFVFPNDGTAANDNGYAKENYEFSFYSVDLAGNLSTLTPSGDNRPQSSGAVINDVRSETVTVYHDGLEPQFVGVNGISSFSYVDNIPGYGLDGNTFGDTAITKDVNIVSSHFSEKSSDILYQVNNTTSGRSNYNVLFDSLILVNGYDENGVLITYPGEGGGTDTPRDSGRYGIGLGGQTDDRTGCTEISNSPIVNRRLGNCEDGIYEVKVRGTDSAGNESGWKSEFVERDTVKPGDATVSFSKTGDILDERASIVIDGEEDTMVELKIFKNGSLLDTRPFNLDGGNYTDTDLLGRLDCGGNDYYVTVMLTDRAGNISGVVTSGTITSDACPSCGGNTLISPFKNPNAYVRYLYGYSEDYSLAIGRTDLVFHSGVDYNGVGDGEPIYSTAPGTVTFAGPLGNYGNMVKVDHGSGLSTWYGHMNALPNVSVNDVVDTNTVIGYVGNTGFSFGAHLHFEVRVNGLHEDPMPYLQGKGSSNDSGNLTPEQRDRFGCVDLRGGTEKSPLEDSTNPDTVDPNDPRVIGSNFIEQPFTVENTNQSEWLTQNDDIRDGVDPFVRNVQFDVVSDNWNEIQESYDGESQVWIVVHGWQNNPDSSSYNNDEFKSTAHMIAQEKPNDIVMYLDWKEASGACCVPFGVKNASEWIRPVSREAKNKLNDWGLYSGSKLNFVGHSLGTLLSTELAREFGGANKSILLDPPSQLTNNRRQWLNLYVDTIVWGYDIDGNNSGDQIPGVNIDGSNYYKNQFNFSRSFVGGNSLAGNQYLAPTSHESFRLSFQNRFCNPLSPGCTADEHNRVIDVFNRINKDTKLYNNLLSIHDLNYSSQITNNNFGTNSINGDFEGEFEVVAWDSPYRTWTQQVRTKVNGKIYSMELRKER
ncbi:MAG: peptidoglycan DD-metalloendopeptidase family protein [Thermales bacterium]|nr:peptidoglycan DD-metalloendopeptidase family protein [Thermales bacterium]